MKTLAQWAYPAAVLALWILLAANTLSGLSTVEPSLKRPRSCEVAVHDAIEATDRPGRHCTESRNDFGPW